MPEEIRQLAHVSTVPSKYSGQRVARLRPRAYRKAVAMLAAGCSVNAIKAACHVDHLTIEGIRANESESITELKAVLVALAARIASGAGESVENDIASGRIKGSAAIVAFGVATDKLLALSGEPTARLAIDIGGTVNIAATFQQIAANVEKVAQAVVIPPAQLPDHS